MTQAQQPEALRLAGICETKGMFPVADELNRMHARILELEQGKCLLQIAEPAAPHAARDLGIAALEQYLKECEENQIVADVGGAFAYAWQRAAAPQAVQPAVPVDAVTDLKNALADATELRQQLRLMEEHTRGEVWRWQADAANELASMGNRMGVLIHASDLRNLLAAAAHPAEGVPAQRAAFVEAWEIINYPIPCNSRMRDDGSYADPEVQAAWEKWQARAAIAATQPAAQMLNFINDKRVALTPEYDGPWKAEVFADEAEPVITSEGNTVRDAVTAALAAQAKQGGA